MDQGIERPSHSIASGGPCCSWPQSMDTDGPDLSEFSNPMRKRWNKAFNELTYLSRQWQPSDDPRYYSFWMASSEVDQKFLGYFAKVTTSENNYLSR